MIAPETLAAALRVAQHGAHRAMLAVRTDTPDADRGDDDEHQPDAPARPQGGHAPRLGSASEIAGPQHHRITRT